MATVSSQISVGTGTPTLLWQTSTGVSPDAAISGQVFRACTMNDPLPIVIENVGANAAFLGGSGVTTGTGLSLAAAASLTFNVVGNDSLYAIAGTATTVSVLVGRQ